MERGSILRLQRRRLSCIPFLQNTHRKRTPNRPLNQASLTRKNSKTDADRRSTPAAASAAPSATVELPGRCRNFLMDVGAWLRGFLLSPRVTGSRLMFDLFLAPGSFSRL